MLKTANLEQQVHDLDQHIISQTKLVKFLKTASETPHVIEGEIELLREQQLEINSKIDVLEGALECCGDYANAAAELRALQQKREALLNTPALKAMALFRQLKRELS